MIILAPIDWLTNTKLINYVNEYVTLNFFMFHNMTIDQSTSTFYPSWIHFIFGFYISKKCDTKCDQVAVEASINLIMTDIMFYYTSD